MTPAGPVTTIVGAEVAGAVADVRLEGGRIAAVDVDLPRSGTVVVEAGGGAVLPGLHDHHLHLLAMAAADRSVDVGGASGATGFDDAVAGAHDDRSSGAWLRVVGYDEGHGPLDASRLDRLAPGRRVRVQHRSGAAWVLSSAALADLGLPTEGEDPPATGAAGRRAGRSVGADHGTSGRAPGGAADLVGVGPLGVGPGTGWVPGEAGTGAAGEAGGTGGLGAGWVLRGDDELGARWDRDPDLDLAAVARRLAALGVTGATDATPTTDPGAFEVLARARRRGDLPQRVVVTGGPALAGAGVPDGIERGPVKVVVADHALPGIDELAAAIRRAHGAGRPVAVHCVTRVALVVALAAWDEAGTVPGDRIEHASVTPVELVPAIAARGLAVVTQPGFLRDRGDVYLDEVEPDDRPHLYRCRSLLDAGIAVGGSTDAPFGPEDPWVAMGAAVERRTGAGRPIGAAEAIEPRRALELFLAPLADPGGPPRRVAPGAPADLVLLDAPLDRALASPDRVRVRATWIDGALVHGNGDR